MGIQAWPFIQTGTSGAPAVTARQWRQMMVAPFVAMGSAARPLGAKSGIRVGTPSSVVTITGTGPYGWSANGFAGIIDGEANAAAGPYAYSVDTAQTGSINPSGAALRVDRLDMVISDSDEGDSSGTKGMAVVYTPGAATGGLPPNAPARSHKLALINVPTAGAPTITWAPDWSGDPGEWQFNTGAERDAFVTGIGSANVPPRQQATVIADTTAVNNGSYTWSGSGWVLSNANPAIIVRRSTTPVSGGANVWQLLTTSSWWSQDYNVGFAAFNGTLVAPVSGWYRMGVGITFNPAPTGLILMVTKNNSSANETGNILRFTPGAAAGELGAYTQKLVKLTAGDVLRLQIFPTATWTWSTDPDDSVFSLELAYI